MSGLLWQNANGDWMLGQMLLHPARDPKAAAAQDLAGLLSKARPEDLVVLAGLGLGWHAVAIHEAPNRPHVVAYEPDTAIGRQQVATGPDLSWLNVAGDPHRLTELIAERVVYAGTSRVAVFSPPAYRNTLPSLANHVRELVAGVVDRGRSDSLTRRTHGLRWASLAAENIEFVLRTPDAVSLPGSFKGLPAFIVGAGPSLSQSLDDLAKVQDKGLILCAASALGPLASVGVAPHCAVALEAKDESRQFVGTNLEAITLIAASNSHGNHFKKWPGPLAHAHLLPWLAQLCGGAAVPNGGHASSLAFTLAYVWGCDPIVLVGQDLAYTGGKVHAEGRPGGEEDGVQGQLTTAAIGGGIVRTSPTFHSYINWYQESASYVARGGAGVRLINASSAGALIPGFRHMPLHEATAGMAEIAMTRQRFNEILAEGRMVERHALAGNLGAARQQLRAAIANAGGKDAGALKIQEAPAVVAYAVECAGGSTEMLPDVLKHLLECVLRMEQRRG